VSEFTIRVNLDAKCKRCGEGGATQNGLCMACIAKAVKNGEFDHILKRIAPHIKDKKGGTNAQT